eukprot:Colp12_sorted_trinity150504_noHs@15272
MVLNTGALKGRTIFITGASRGIGKAIALKCAKDGANVVIAAKTASPHPKLPGTIYTAAKEIEEAGGQCLPCIVDIRDENQIAKAVDDTVKQFGGIDILVNNASAISLTGTLQTPMKKFDLMMNVNCRGTYATTQACLPHLLKSPKASVLMLSPPLNMNSFWFKGHVAYTMAKYGMSMCVHGMSEEFRDKNIAFNALWPRTAIWTSAMDMLGGDDSRTVSRTVDIMSDAAYLILSDSKFNTGNFYIDDDLLYKHGVRDFSKYACEPGQDLMVDFFLDGTEAITDVDKRLAAEKAAPKQQAVSATPPPAAEAAPAAPSSAKSDDAALEAVFSDIRAMINPDLLKKVNGVFNFNLKDGGVWHVDLKKGGAGVGPKENPDVEMTLSRDNFIAMFSGNLKPVSAYMTGRLKINGNMALAMKLEKLVKARSSKL